jgi:alkylated DNA repair dioxygenase AlkB
VSALLAEGDVRYIPAWLSADEADSAFSQVRDSVPFDQHRVRLFGRELPAPRLSAWIGDPEARYRYSKVSYEPLPWPTPVAILRDRLNAEFGAIFNSVLVNFYRGGSDSMGWHSDDEPELGPMPLIASLSLGATRRFKFKRRGGNERAHIDLAHGSLLLMAGTTQQNYLHAIDKVAAAGERINLTFRRILPIASPKR